MTAKKVAMFCVSILSMATMPLQAVEDDLSVKEAFTKIYDTGAWGRNSAGEGFSGSGSLLEQTVGYRQFLQKFLSDHNITSVVDIGCGDWTFSHAIDWTNVNYLGLRCC